MYRKIINNKHIESSGRKKWLMGFYIRLSNEDRDKKGEPSDSVENQEMILQEYIEDHDDEFEFVDLYVDDGRTGTDTNRPDFQRMLRDIDKGKINCVIVKDGSRWARNYLEAGNLINSFINDGVRFISLSLPQLDTFLEPEKIDSLEVVFHNYMNEDYARQTSVKVRCIKESKIRKGKYMGACPLYGYIKDPQDIYHLIIDDEAAEVVKSIFHWFVRDGYSKTAICKKLNALGYPNPALYKKQKGYGYYHPSAENNDGFWNTRTITKMLSNQMYVGHMVQGKQKVISYKNHTQVNVPRDEWVVVENTHEAIVDKDIFDKAQKLLEMNTKTPSGNQKVFLFAGFLRCYDCQKAMQRHVSKNRVYYICSTNENKSKKSCTRHTIREDMLENAVLQAIQEQISHVENMSQIIDEINKAPVINNESKRIIEQLSSQRRSLEKETRLRDGLYEDWKNGDITKEEYHHLKAKYQDNIDVFKKSIQILEEKQRELQNGVNINNPCLEQFKKHKNIQSLDRGVLTALIDTIYIHEGKRITIRFNFNDEHKRMEEFIENNLGAVRTDKTA